jgi:hypothetical protein
LHTNHASFSSIPIAGRRNWQKGAGLSDWSGLSANENQDACCERQNTRYDNRDGDCMEERNDADDDQIDCQQQHAEIFCDVYHVCVSLADDLDLS